MADANSFRNKLYAALEKTVDELEEYSAAQRAQPLANVALAFRYAYGGQQPGGHPQE